jgi:magnesium-transporting ATPase (P-type)
VPVEYFQIASQFGSSYICCLIIVRVVRDGSRATIPVQDIVPGDVVVLKTGVVFCDMVVLKAEHLMVDEAALTGESNPIAKAELDSALSKTEYDSVRHKNHTIFAGTEIIETGDHEKDLGLVLSTGSFTRKGTLLTDILSYQRAQFLFDDEIKIVLMILILQATFYITLVFQWQKEQFVFAYFYGVYILGTVIPPLLPTVFVVSVGISANRLQNKRITCTNPEAILVAGKVNVCCFDKTGTITEAGMDFVGVDCSDEGMKKQATIGMAVCHNLKASASGELIGNHVDKASFTSSLGKMRFDKGEKVVIEHDGVNYTILKQYDFDNQRQTQSSIVQSEDGLKHIFVKGSPEAIRKLCTSESVPKTFQETLRTGAKSGIYQLAMAYKAYDLDQNLFLVSRDDVEKSVSFSGFILLKNPMKKETPEIMRKLSEGNVLLTMITGDNVLTGVNIARESGMCTNEKLLVGQIGAD